MYHHYVARIFSVIDFIYSKPFFTLHLTAGFIFGVITTQYPIIFYGAFMSLIVLSGHFIFSRRFSLLICSLGSAFSLALSFTYTNQIVSPNIVPIEVRHPISTATLHILEEPTQKGRFTVFQGKWLEKEVIVLAKIKASTDSIGLSYGQLIKTKGQLSFPTPPTNPGQFDYSAYLRKHHIQGIFTLKKWQVVDRSSSTRLILNNPLRKLAYSLKKKIILITNQTLKYPYNDLYVGLIFGDHGTQLPDEWNDRYQRLGLTHLLVVSGAQVSLLVGTVLAFIRALNLSNGLTFIIISFVNTLFYLITGGGSSIFRAVIMCEIALGLSLLKRHPSILHVLSFTALVMLILNPLSLYDLGAQLSFLATISLIYVAKQLETIFPESWPKWLKGTLAITFGPFITTLPLLWYAFQQLSLISLISNFLVLAGVEWIVTIGFFSTVIGFFLPWVTLVLNQFCWLIMAILNITTLVLDKVPFGMIYLSKPSLFTILFLYFILFYGLNAYAKKDTLAIKWIHISGVTFFTVLLFSALLPNRHLTVTFLDVGQGDSIIIETPTRKTLVLDAGNRVLDFKTGEPLMDMGERIVYPALKYKGINKIDGIIVSHFDQDHFGGIPFLLNQFPVGTVFDNGRFQKYNRYLKPIQDKQIHHQSILSSQTVKLDRYVSLQFFFLPLSQTSSKNDASLIVKLSYGEIDFLFTGDLEIEGENQLVTLYGPHLKSEILKAGHHGSKTSNTPAFLQAVSPQAVVISAGRKNRYRHPSPSVIRRLQEQNLSVYRTDRDGAITFKTDGKRMFVHTFLNNDA